MRKDIHPAYQQVLFHDTNADVYFLIGSTIQTKQTKEYQGQVYPYVTLDISSDHTRSTQVKLRQASNEGRVASLTNASLALIVRVNLTLSFNQYT